MANTLTKQIAEIEKQYANHRKEFLQNDGKITPDEDAVLKQIAEKLATLREVDAAERAAAKSMKQSSVSVSEVEKTVQAACGNAKFNRRDAYNEFNNLRTHIPMAINTLEANMKAARDKFKKYADGRIKQLSASATIADAAFKMMVETVVGVLDDVLSPKVASALGRALLKQVLDLGKKAGTEIKYEPNKGLEGARDALGEAPVWAARKLRFVYESNRGPRPVLLSIWNKLSERTFNKDATKFTPEELQIIGTFYQAGSKQLGLIETQFGIPTKSTSKELYLAAFKKMVYQFEQQCVEREALQKNHGPRQKTRINAKRTADRRANAAEHKLREETDKEIAQQ